MAGSACPPILQLPAPNPSHCPASSSHRRCLSLLASDLALSLRFGQRLAATGSHPPINSLPSFKQVAGQFYAARLCPCSFYARLRSSLFLLPLRCLSSHRAILPNSPRHRSPVGLIPLRPPQLPNVSLAQIQTLNAQCTAIRL
jgi:hypothetical protein